ncbi:MAG: PhzF family phenazine biosynthesis protein [Acidobacteria bacterium]|nr:PhzF family phenazine biosynthesis protein [Acidobacteriota bacterium]
MKLPLYQVDAFTTSRFRGNPAAVVVMDEWLPDALLQAIAAENNLAETAFVIAKSGSNPLRWFSPAIEIDLCGHATLATAHVLFHYYFPGEQQLVFSTKSGDLTVTNEAGILAMNFPSRPGRPVEVSDALRSALETEPREVFESRDLLVILDSEEEISNFRPDAQRIATLDTFAVIISAPGKEVDFVSRFFAPRAGVLEDPVTGSSHCTLTPYWASRLGKSSLTARQLSERGGEIRCELRGDRVIIGGATVEYLRGEITF